MIKKRWSKKNHSNTFLLNNSNHVNSFCLSTIIVIVADVAVADELFECVWPFFGIGSLRFNKCSTGSPEKAWCVHLSFEQIKIGEKQTPF